MNKRYLFLIAWIAGSEGEQDSLDYDDDTTNIHSQEDLMPEFRKNNEHIFAVEIFAPDESIAEAIGYQAAFFEDYTAHDTLSVCEEIPMSDPDQDEYPCFEFKDNKIMRV